MKTPIIPTQEPKTKTSLVKEIRQTPRAYSLQKQMSLRHLSAASNIDPGDILKYENGSVNPTLTSIASLARGLGVHTRDLIDFEIDWPTFQ